MWGNINSTAPRQYLSDITTNQLQLSSLDDWHLVPGDHSSISQSLASSSGGIMNMLSTYYPEHDWKFESQKELGSTRYSFPFVIG